MRPVRGRGGPVTMQGNNWLLLLPLLLNFNIVTSQPVTSEARRLDPSECCPCPWSARSPAGVRSHDDLTADPTSSHCSCEPRADDAEASASILMPALRALQPFVKQSDQTEPKPLLQPEVGLASSVLETLRQATDEEYQDALARDAARSTVKLLEATLDPFDDAIMETPKNKVRIFLNKDADDMDDNLPEPSHIQETRCIHSPLESIHKQLRMNRPTPVIELIEVLPKPTRKLSNKGVLHRKFQHMDSGIGASNINEQVIQPDSDHNLKNGHLNSNPTLFGLFTQSNPNTEDQKGLQKNLRDEFNQSQEVKQKIHLKLRELLDNLEIKKSKVPIIDLKKYITPATRIPPLQLGHVDKTIPSNKPLLLKDLLKLKDVELIPRKSLTKSANAKQPALKLQSQSSNTNEDVDNCDADNSNLQPIMNQDIEMTTIPIYTDFSDPETSPTNSNSVFSSKHNEVNRNINKKIKPTKSIANAISSVPTNFESQGDFDISDIKPEKDRNRKQSFNNCIVTEKSLMQPESENEDKRLNNDNFQEEKAQKLNNNDDINKDELDNETFQIDFLEDFDTPIEVDNSSFNPKTDLKNSDDVHTLNDPVAETSNHVFEISNQNNESPSSQENRDEFEVVDCNSLESFSKNSNFILDNQSSLEEFLPQQTQSEPINSALNTFSNINVDPNQVSFRDLQDMSDSILSLSECDPSTEEKLNTQSNFNEDLDQVNDDFDMPNTGLPTLISDEIPKGIGTEDGDNDDFESNINTNGNLVQESNINSSKDSWKSTASDESLTDINPSDDLKSINFDEERSEMRAEASEPQPKSCDHIDPLNENIFESDKETNIFTKASTAFNDISKADKHSMFLNNLRSKLEGLFSTTEKVGDVSINADDNINESSNMNPTLAKSNKLLRTPQSLLQKITQPELPGKYFNSLSDKLALPKFVNPPLASNSLNLFKFPNPFEDLPDPGQPLTVLSDTLRSHTENTIQNVKETLESTLKDSQNLRLSRPTDQFGTHDLLDSISNRRDEMKEKLEAIHSDLNDRFSSFQQSVLDHFSLPSENLEFQDGGHNGGLRSSYTPLKQERERNSLPQWNNPKIIGKHTKINIAPSRIPTASDPTRSLNSDRKLKTPAEIYTTSTSIPSFIARPKILKTNIGSTPRLKSETPLQGRPSNTIVPKEKLSKIKSLSWKPEKTSDFSEESLSLSRYLPAKSFKANTENNNRENLSSDSPVEKFRKAFLQNNLKQKPRHDHTKNHGKENDGSNNIQESFRSRLKEGRTKTGPKHKDGMTVSPSSHLDTTHPSHKESGPRLVEPLKENVPYKCRLICYKD